MVQHSADIYGAMGSVPFDPSVAPTGAPNAKMTEQANPADMGAAIGEGISKVGEAATNTANMYGGMVMETAANQSELGYLKASGDLEAKYKQYEGNQAEAMRPQYEAELQAIHQQFRGNLPLMAQKMFDQNTIRSLGIQNARYADYAAGQVKEANLKSNDAIADANIARGGNLATVLDPKLVGESIGNIVHSANAVADTKGWTSFATGTDPGTGKLTFGDSPQAQATKAQYEQYLGEKQSKFYLTAAQTIADNQGAEKAADWAKAHWDMIPDVGKVAMNKFLAPKMVNEDINGAIATANSQMTANYANNVAANVPNSPTAPLSVRNNNPGNIRDSNTGEFKVFNTPEEGTKAMQDDLAIKISGNSPAMKKNFGENYLPTLSNLIATWAPAADKNDPVAYTNTVSKATGIKPDQVLTKDDIAKLIPAMSKVEAGGSGAQPQQPQKQYSNDYERLLDNRQAFIDNAVNSITQKRGTDLGLIATTEKRAAASIDAQIRTAKGALEADQKGVQDAINGSLSRGGVPMTIEQLRALPGMAAQVDKVQREQPEFYNSIDTRIAKAQHADSVHNSSNAYDAIQATLDSKDYSRQERIEYLSKGLGSDNPGYSISQKDFNDAKPAVDLKSSRKIFSSNLKQIAQANGNIDGKGQERAVEWYNQVMEAWKENQGKEGSNKMSEVDFFNPEKNDSLPTMPMPSRQQQIANAVPKNGLVNVINPDGKPGAIPAENFDKALALGYKKAP